MNNRNYLVVLRFFNGQEDYSMKVKGFSNSARQAQQIAINVAQNTIDPVTLKNMKFKRVFGRQEVIDHWESEDKLHSLSVHQLTGEDIV